MNELRACLSVSGALLLAALFGTALPVHAQQDAARATPPPGKVLVFVYRNDREPQAARVPVFVNLARIGELANGTFVVATVNPGRTFLRVGEQAVATFALEAAANRSYFVRVEVVPGMKPVRTEVRLVSETEGRRVLAQSRLVGPAPAGFAAAPRAQPPAPKPAPRPPVAAAPRVPPPPAPAAAAPRAQPPAPKPAPQPPVAAAPRAPAKPAARPAREAAPSEEPDGEWKLALIANAGTFKLANENQTLAGLPGTYDTTSSPVLGIGAEWRSKTGLAAGGEVFYYKNELVTNPGTATAANSQQQVIAIMANGKYYFRVADWFYPFAGAGIGLAEAVYSGGSLKGNAGGLAYQGLAGMEFRFGSVGVQLQYKYLAATTGKSDKVKVGGGGILAGVSFVF